MSSEIATITVKAFPPLHRVRDSESGDTDYHERPKTPSRIPRPIKKKVVQRRSKGKQPDGKKKLVPVISVDTSRARGNLDAVRLVLKQLGWREYPYGRKITPCDFYWSSSNFNECRDIYAGKINKFPGMVESAHKVNLARALTNMRSLYPEEYQFFPQTWMLPEEFHDFCADIAREKEKNQKRKQTFIVKPNEGSQGEGIYLIREAQDYRMNGRSHVVQKYIAKPLLLEKLKFDLRLYVVLKSIDPLEIYILKEGMARLCTLPYRPPTNKNLHEAYMHLTNYSLNKYSTTYLHTDNEHDGSKRTLRSVFTQLERCGYDAQKAWIDIEKSTIKTIMAIVPELRIAYNANIPPGKPGPSCFQILGFDFLLTEDLKAILLEVNANPSLRIDFEKEISPGVFEYVPSLVDEEIKRPLIKETLMLLAPKSKQQQEDRPKPSQNPNEELDQSATDSILQEQNEISSNTSVPEEKLLDQIYPLKYGTLYKDLNLLDRLALIFQHCLSVRSTVRMGSSGFRTFARNCRITHGGISSAELDIIFIEQCRRWDFLNPDGTAGLNLHGFMEAFMILAKKKFYSNNKAEMVENLVDYCEANLQFGKMAKRVQNGNRLSVKVDMSSSEKRLQDLQSIYISQQRHHHRFHRPGDGYYLDYKNFNPYANKKQEYKKIDKSKKGDG